MLTGDVVTDAVARGETTDLRLGAERQHLRVLIQADASAAHVDCVLFLIYVGDEYCAGIDHVRRKNAIVLDASTSSG